MKISVEEFDKLNENYQNLSSQIDKLASFIMENIEGEPSRSEGAVDCAIRLLEKYKKTKMMNTPRPLKDWGEDYGDCLWWEFPIEEPPYIGSPLDSNWPGYHTHFTEIEMLD